MAKSQISTSVPPRTLEQYKELVRVYGTGSAVLTVAIDRLHSAELPHKCQGCGTSLPRSASPYAHGEHGLWLCDECADPTGDLDAETMAELDHLDAYE